MVKSILKRGERESSSRKYSFSDGRLKWDEDNLQLSELQKTATMKIDEPKTPYVHYCDREEGEESESASEMSLIELEEGGEEEEEAEGEEEEEVSEYEQEEQRERREEQEHREEFSRHRSAHYDMREAMAKAKQLLQEE